MKLKLDVYHFFRERPAAFGRLCVETLIDAGLMPEDSQPPSGGCVLKHGSRYRRSCLWSQPPSGGCVLKRGWTASLSKILPPAAFGRLCVETSVNSCALNLRLPAAFGRLCVETSALNRLLMLFIQPPSGGCVLKLDWNKYIFDKCYSSRLRAAVC